MGSINVTVTAINTAGENVSDTYILTVNNINDAPTLSADIANATAIERVAYSYNASIHFNEVDVGDTLAYSATLSDGGTLPSWLTIDSTTGILNGTPANGDNGTIDVTVTATDTAGLSVSDTYTLTVDINTNIAPILTTAIPNAVCSNYNIDIV